ncbi:putative F-box protein At5g52610 isoform X1 [Papaver somniferum]|uniref:putative F-box protein At5g52610 isoform X1 n=1 Tax=Papaver somniferum TaxID=3469 RepID=UPI000E703BFA|nr:putative F-box protein At5g52610 isoform X1 [Papaver somniferum]
MNRKKMKVSYGDIFGGDDLILCDILSRLPVKSVMRFKLVCTHWRSLIKEDKYLIDLHLVRSKTRREGTKLLISSVLGRKMDLFFCDLFQGGPAIPLLGRKATDDDRNNTFDETLMLNPVNGLICFVKPFEGSVLVYNPSTGYKTSWLETRTRKLMRDHNGQAVDTSRMRWGFGFGFDPATKEHKVVSVFETMNTEQKISKENPYGLDVQNCEVLTVGVQNEWRQIDKSSTPGYIVGASVYVNGVIYWLDEHHKVHEVIMAFDVRGEKFNKVIVIPTFINNRWRDYPVNGGIQTICIYVDLIEIDGHIALLERVDGSSIGLWIYSGVNTSDINYGNWIEEKINFPFDLWDSYDDYVSFEAIIGTDLMIIKNFNQQTKFETLYYYNRKRNNIEKQVEIKGIYRDRDAVGLKFSTYVDSLMPVQGKRDPYVCYTPGWCSRL